jgi:hypothetical protein
MADLEPIILVDPELIISGVSLKCLMSHVEMTPDVSTIEIKTSCGVRDYPGTIKWGLKATLYHNFDPEGTNEVLTAAVEGGVPVPFSVIPSAGKPVSATNPAFVGELIPQPFTPLSGDVGDASSLDLEWSIKGWLSVPTTSTTPATAATGATAGTPGTWTPSGATPPATVADLIADVPNAVTASPTTAWTVGQYVQTGAAGAGGEASWDGAAWEAGRAL